MTSSRTHLFVIAALGVVALAFAPIAASATTSHTVYKWNKVPVSVSSTQTVWVPKNTAGISLHSTTGITATACQKPSTGYDINALYSNQTATDKKQQPSFTIDEQTTNGCSDAGYTFYGQVSSFKNAYATVTIWAECGIELKTDKPLPGWTGYEKCQPADVLTHSGWIQLEQTKKTKARYKTRVNIDTTLLSYAKVLKIAKGLTPLN